MKIIKYLIEFIFIYILLIIFKIIGYKNASNLGEIIGKKIGPFIRPKKYSQGDVNLRTVQKFSLKELEKKKIFPDLIVHLEETYPFRDNDLIDNAIKVLLKNGYDTVIAAKEEKGWLWKENINGFQRIEEGDIPQKIKKKTYLGLHGICCVTYPEFIREGLLIGKNIGLLPIENHLSVIEIRDQETHRKFSKILKKY